jgi:hypothetical protein
MPAALPSLLTHSPATHTHTHTPPRPADNNECTASVLACSPFANCADTQGSYTCACKLGYTGDGYTCADMDECTAGTHKCHAKATCIKTAGSYACVCNDGFSGNGFSCSDIKAPVLNVGTTSRTLTATAAAGASAVKVALPGFTAQDNDTPNANITCTAPTGSGGALQTVLFGASPIAADAAFSFPLGSTEMSCSAKDAAGNESPAVLFSVVASCPAGYVEDLLAGCVCE